MAEGLAGRGNKPGAGMFYQAVLSTLASDELHWLDVEGDIAL
ncbi:MAG: hypothetical protein AB1767_06525 [Bacillota bacterium]